MNVSYDLNDSQSFMQNAEMKDLDSKSDTTLEPIVQ